MIRSFEDGDIVTAKHEGQFKEGKEATAQGLKHRLRMFLGEYFLDISDGTPWFQSVLGKAPQDIAEVNIKERILSAPDVVGLTGFDFETDSNERSITIKSEVLDVNNEQLQFLFSEELI